MEGGALPSAPCSGGGGGGGQSCAGVVAGYWRKRAARILPAYLLANLLFLATFLPGQSLPPAAQLAKHLAFAACPKGVGNNLLFLTNAGVTATNTCGAWRHSAQPLLLIVGALAHACRAPRPSRCVCKTLACTARLPWWRWSVGLMNQLAGPLNQLVGPRLPFAAHRRAPVERCSPGARIRGPPPAAVGAAPTRARLPPPPGCCAGGSVCGRHPLARLVGVCLATVGTAAGRSVPAGGECCCACIPGSRVFSNCQPSGGAGRGSSAGPAAAFTPCSGLAAAQARAATAGRGMRRQCICLLRLHASRISPPPAAHLPQAPAGLWPGLRPAGCCGAAAGHLWWLPAILRTPLAAHLCPPVRGAAVIWIPTL